MAGPAAALARAHTAARAEMQLVREAGRIGEDAAGIIKNTRRIPSATGSAAYRVPDVLDDSINLIGEVKNVGSLSYSRQLRDIAAYAKENGYTFVLWVRPGQGTALSGPLREMIERGEIVLRELVVK